MGVVYCCYHVTKLILISSLLQLSSFLDFLSNAFSTYTSISRCPLQNFIITVLIELIKLCNFLLPFVGFQTVLPSIRLHSNSSCCKTYPSKAVYRDIIVVLFTCANTSSSLLILSIPTNLLRSSSDLYFGGF